MYPNLLTVSMKLDHEFIGFNFSYRPKGDNFNIGDIFISLVLQFLNYRRYYALSNKDSFTTFKW